MNATAQSTGASVANINMLKDGSIDLAIIQNDITYYAANGTEMFKDKKSIISAVLPPCIRKHARLSLLNRRVSRPLPI